MTGPPSKITLSGVFQVEDPDNIHFPIKVLFAIDDSGSMGPHDQGPGNDPNNIRIDATRNFINEYSSDQNVSFYAVLWASEPRAFTDAFTQDTALLDSVLSQAQDDGGTDYMDVLNHVQNALLSDIQAEKDVDLRARTKYIVVFLSDGLPNPDVADNIIIDKVTQIYEMVMSGGAYGFTMNTYLLANGLSGDQRASCEALLLGMANAGQGDSAVLETPNDIDFINTVDMEIAVFYRLRHIIAFNYSVRPGDEVIHADSDGDGLTDDEEENEYGTDPRRKDTDSDGYSDFFEVTRSTSEILFDPLVADLQCEYTDIDGYLDSDGDGLTDCEELYLQSDITDIDTDNDGLPDDIEFLSGTNLIEPELILDTDSDGFLDRNEVQQHTNPVSDDPKIQQRYKYDYSLVAVDEADLQKANVKEYEFSVSNIDLLETLGCYEGGQQILEPGENLIRFYFSEVAEDRPDPERLIYRVMEVKAKYSTYDTEEESQILVTKDDFELIQADF